MINNEGIQKKILTNVPFKVTESDELLADLYFPSSPQSSPALILVHGGAWKLGSKEMYRDWGPYFAEAGYVVMSINYRLATPDQPTWPIALDDVRSAYYWIIENADMLGVNPDRIGLIGDSCGAHLSTLLAFEKHSKGIIRTIIGVYGVYNLREWWNFTQQTRNDDPVGCFIGASPFQAPEKYAEASPTSLVTKGKKLNAKLFLIWGDQDSIVPPNQSLEFIKALRDTGVDPNIKVIRGMGHYWFTLIPDKPGGGLHDDPNSTLAPDLLDFLKQNL